MAPQLTLTSSQVSQVVEDGLRLQAAEGMWGEANDFSATATSDRSGSYVLVRSWPANLDGIADELRRAGYAVFREAGEDTETERLVYGLEATTTTPYDRLVVTLPEGA